MGQQQIKPGEELWGTTAARVFMSSWKVFQSCDKVKTYLY